MKPDMISDALSQVDEAMLAEADEARRKRKKRSIRCIISVAASVCAVAVIGLMIVLVQTGGDVIAAAEPVYPTISPYPDGDLERSNITNAIFMAQADAWEESRKAIMPERGYGEGLDGFFEKTIAEFLSDIGNESRVFSPLSLYMALSVTAETAEGESRQQILDLIGSENIEALRTQANEVWRGSYSNDGATTSILANSLWIDKELGYNQLTVNTIADSYYAGVYRGEMGSDALNKAMQKWLNEQTGGLLKEQVSDFEVDDPTAVMTLFSTVYYRAKWFSEFKEANTETGVFHSPDGDVEAEFMYKRGDNTYYWSENFAAMKLLLENSGHIWLILPDEDVTMDELLADEKVYELILDKNAWEDQKRLIVNLRLPKFDISSDFSLNEGLQELGVADIFDGAAADFTPLADDMEEVRRTYGGNIAISEAKQAARVTIDEEGVTAAAFTAMLYCGAAEPPDEEVDFTLDRPFFFALSHDSGLPMFAGVVNVP